MSKKKIRLISFLLLVCVFLSACEGLENAQDSNEQEANMVEVALYYPYIESDSSKLVEKEYRFVKKPDNILFYKAIIEEMMKGPTGENFRNLFKENTELIYCRVSNGMALVVFNEEAKHENVLDEIIFKSTIVLTLTELININRVGVYYGAVQHGPAGSYLNLITRRDVVLDDVTSTIGEKNIYLHYPSGKDDNLVKERRTVKTTVNDNLEHVIIEELLKGPTRDGLFMPFEIGTATFATVSESGICVVNFSKPIFKKNLTEEQLLLGIYSIVNSLCEVEKIEYVQFMLNGKVDADIMKYTQQTYYSRESGLND